MREFFYRSLLLAFLIIVVSVSAEMSQTTQNLLIESVKRNECLGAVARSYAPEDRKIAHVNIAFEYSGDSKLPSIQKDADFYSELSKKMGISSKTIKDTDYFNLGEDLATRKQKLLESIEGSLTGKREAWFTFAGHGGVDKHGKSVMNLPIDNPVLEKAFSDNCGFSDLQNTISIRSGLPKITATIDLKKKFKVLETNFSCADFVISMTDVMQTAKNAGVNNLFVSSDSCFSGAIEKSMEGIEGLNVAALMSSGSTEVSRSTLEEGGFFTNELRKTLNDNDFRSQADLNSNKQLTIGETMVLPFNFKDHVLADNESLKTQTECSSVDIELHQTPTFAANGLSSSFMGRVIADWTDEESGGRKIETTPDSHTE